MGINSRGNLNLTISVTLDETGHWTMENCGICELGGDCKKVAPADFSSIIRWIPPACRRRKFWVVSKSKMKISFEIDRVFLFPELLSRFLNVSNVQKFPPAADIPFLAYGKTNHQKVPYGKSFGYPPPTPGEGCQGRFMRTIFSHKTYVSPFRIPISPMGQPSLLANLWNKRG